MRSIVGAGIAVLATLLPATARAELVKIPLRANAEIRIAFEPPQGAAAAYALIFAGGHGKIQLDDAGRPQGLRGNFLLRARQTLTARGIGLVLVDAPSDRQGERGLAGYRMTPEHAAEIGKVMGMVRQRFAGPVWLVGTSAGTASVAMAAAALTGAERPNGIVLSSSLTRQNKGRGNTVFTANLAAYAGAAFVVSHESDGCAMTPAADAPQLLQALASARPKKLQIFTGGSPARSDPCEAMAPHGFIGIESQVMNAIADFILRPGN